MGKLMGSDKAEISRYAKVERQTRLSFPQDHGAHEDYRQEWWYLTANLHNQQGEALGLQWTQFRIALSPPENSLPTAATTGANQADSSVKDSQPGWATSQLYMAHSAVTTASEHLSAERWSRGNPQLAGVESSPLRIFLDDWQWQSRTDDLLPAVLQGGDREFSYRLKLGGRSPYQLQGEQGFSIKSADGKVASHYYSQPYIHIKGEVTIRGTTHQVMGKGWLDREWSSQFLTGEQQGWDWFALRLGEHQGRDTTLMLFQLRGGAGAGQHFYSGRLMRKDGTGRQLASQEIRMQVLKTHSSAKTQGKVVPIEWQINIPTEQIALTVQALNADAMMPLTIKYWEGPVIISGSHQGTGYMELTGY
ncbi:lipocalin-like domain-containing protein [Shewanella sp. GXUN23E]|uniref:lipocalin-like domain-containing protein n=1 Tax=Shewanella sp. GXUN23E TaxID=3422498 RepID=UPI003D7D491D